jgi:flagellum-specific peptidoglycan hydrolase FlgJ
MRNKRFIVSIILMVILSSCAREPLELPYDTFRQLRSYDSDLDKVLREGTRDWLQGNLPDIKPYQQEFLNNVLVPSLAEELKWGLPMEVMTAQAILESGWGRSTLAMEYKNYFGIKEYRKGRQGVKYYSDEIVKGKRVSRKSRFRAYDTPQECFVDRSEWFLANSRYEDLDFHDLDYEEFATELQVRGYATDTNYTRNLLRIIKKYKLNEFSNWIKRSI